MCVVMVIVRRLSCWPTVTYWRKATLSQLSDHTKDFTRLQSQLLDDNVVQTLCFSVASSKLRCMVCVCTDECFVSVASCKVRCMVCVCTGESVVVCSVVTEQVRKIAEETMRNIHPVYNIKVSNSLSTRDGPKYVKHRSLAEEFGRMFCSVWFGNTRLFGVICGFAFAAFCARHWR